MDRRYPIRGRLVHRPLCKETKQSNQCYITSWSAPEQLTSHVAAQCRQFQKSYPGTVFVGDPAWKTTLQDLSRKYRVPIKIAKKQRKQDAIRDLNGEFEGVAWNGGVRRVTIHLSACHPLVDELSVLPWHTTVRGERVEHPGFPNHCSDALLYAWRDATHWSYAEDQVKETYNERTVRILRERERKTGVGGMFT